MRDDAQRAINLRRLPAAPFSTLFWAGLAGQWGNDLLGFHSSLTSCPPLLFISIGFKEEYAKAADWVRTSMPLNASFDASVFETIIRVVGGLLAAHDLEGDAWMVERWVLEGGGGRGGRVVGLGEEGGGERAPELQRWCRAGPDSCGQEAGGRELQISCRLAPPPLCDPPRRLLAQSVQGAPGGGPPAARVRHPHPHPAQHHQPGHPGRQKPDLEPAVGE